MLRKLRGRGHLATGMEIIQRGFIKSTFTDNYCNPHHPHRVLPSSKRIVCSSLHPQPRQRESCHPRNICHTRPLSAINFSHIFSRNQKITMLQPCLLRLKEANQFTQVYGHHSTISPHFFFILLLHFALLDGVRCLSDSISVPCNNCCGPGLDRLNIYNDYIILYVTGWPPALPLTPCIP